MAGQSEIPIMVEKENEKPKVLNRTVIAIHQHLDSLDQILMNFLESDKKMCHELEILSDIDFVYELTIFEDKEKLLLENINKLKRQLSGLQDIIFSIKIRYDTIICHRDMLRHKIYCLGSLIHIIIGEIEELISSFPPENTICVEPPKNTTNIESHENTASKNVGVINNGTSVDKDSYKNMYT